MLESMNILMAERTIKALTSKAVTASNTGRSSVKVKNTDEHAEGDDDVVAHIDAVGNEHGGTGALADRGLVEREQQFAGNGKERHINGNGFGHAVRLFGEKLPDGRDEHLGTGKENEEGEYFGGDGFGFCITVDVFAVGLACHDFGSDGDDNGDGDVGGGVDTVAHDGEAAAEKAYDELGDGEGGVADDADDGSAHDGALMA